MLFFTSDLHFCHNKAFLYAPRGFSNVWDMNKAIVENWNSIINMDDDVYVLGDLMLNDNDEGLRLIKQLKGKIHIILGNHDSDARVELYKTCWNVVEITYATIIQYNYEDKKFRFYLSHYPTITTNLDENYLSQHLFNLYGHTHQKNKFYNDIPWIYNVGCDCQDCKPVSIEQIIEDCKKQYKECGDML